MGFRFEVDEPVRVATHPARPRATITVRWRGEDVGDVYGENIYAVSGFITRQRESSLAREGFELIPMDTLADWRMAGFGTFGRAGPSTLESDAGPGILWYTREEFADFELVVDWRTSSPEDNAGVFLRIPALRCDDPENDWKPAVDEGYEVQIDDRGVDPETGATGSAWHRTGAIYRLAPALVVASHPTGVWNTFEVEARESTITVALNGVPVSRLSGSDGRRRRTGYLGLQAHHPGARVRFRNLQIKRLE